MESIKATLRGAALGSIFFCLTFVYVLQVEEKAWFRLDLPQEWMHAMSLAGAAIILSLAYRVGTRGQSAEHWAAFLLVLLAGSTTLAAARPDFLPLSHAAPPGAFFASAALFFLVTIRHVLHFERAAAMLAVTAAVTAAVVANQRGTGDVPKLRVVFAVVAALSLASILGASRNLLSMDRNHLLMLAFGALAVPATISTAVLYASKGPRAMHVGGV